jgi:hypothetical protein
MKDPSGKSPHRAVELFPICFLVYTYAFPPIFWLSSFSVALSAVIIRMGGALFGGHTRVSALFFLKNLTSSSLNCTVCFVLFHFSWTVYSPI